MALGGCAPMKALAVMPVPPCVMARALDLFGRCEYRLTTVEKITASRGHRASRTAAAMRRRKALSSSPSSFTNPPVPAASARKLLRVLVQ
jgi:hypothetical protein